MFRGKSLHGPRTARCVRAALVALLVLVCALPACRGSRETDAPMAPDDATLFQMGSARVTRISTDRQSRTIAAKLTTRRGARTAYVEPIPDSPLPNGVRATIVTETGNTLFQIDMAWSESSEQLWIREQSGSDVRTMWRNTARGQVFESYDVTGDRAEFDYPLLPPGQMDKLAAAVRSGRSTSGLPPEHREVALSFERFAAYYAPHTTNSLHANPDGELLLQLIAEPAFVQRAIGGGQPPTRIKSAAGRICFIAATCTSLKCRFGGWANPLCIACGGTAVTCFMAEVGCWIAGCEGPY